MKPANKNKLIDTDKRMVVTTGEWVGGGRGEYRGQTQTSLIPSLME